jgi:hypothetical protein
MSEAYILPNENNFSKFNSCRHRSNEEVSKTIRRCSCQGGNLETKGFLCYKRNIFKIDENFCNACNEYEAK